MDAPQEIALAFPRRNTQEILVQGVLRYARENGLAWTYISAPESVSLTIEDLIGWPGDGIIASLQTPTQMQLAQSLNLPIVNISSALPDPQTPSCVTDNEAIGQMAAEHLLSRAYQRYAYYGLMDVEYSKQRYVAFDRAIRNAGYGTERLLVTSTFGLQGNRWLSQHQALTDWLGGLETPIAVFAVSDYRARQVLDACGHLKLRVPDDVVVLGVDNEHLVCDHSVPTLSSVARNDGLVGYTAAGMLHALMTHQQLARNIETIPPLHVVQRESTARFAVADPRLQDAITFLFEHLHEPISIEDITRHAHVSRRWLEYAFREKLGETPFQYLRRHRVALARQLLVNQPQGKLSGVALRCGFSSAKQLAAAFQQTYGMSPRDYRRDVFPEHERTDPGA